MVVEWTYLVAGGRILNTHRAESGLRVWSLRDDLVLPIKRHLLNSISIKLFIGVFVQRDYNI